MISAFLVFRDIQEGEEVMHVQLKSGEQYLVKKAASNFPFQCSHSEMQIPHFKYCSQLAW